jgi:membrane-bound serine protease (ClpP class)
MLFGGHMIARVDAGYAALAFIIGLGLLLLELLVIPGFGIAGVSGIMLMLGGIVFIFGKSYELMTAVFWLSTSFIATVALGIGLMYMIPRTRTGKGFILSTELEKRLGYQASSESLKDYIGREGVALTPLRPAGAVIIGESRLDVVTEGGFIDKNTPIKVVKVEGAQLVVREVKKGRGVKD